MFKSNLYRLFVQELFLTFIYVIEYWIKFENLESFETHNQIVNVFKSIKHQNKKNPNYFDIRRNKRKFEFCFYHKTSLIKKRITKLPEKQISIEIHSKESRKQIKSKKIVK